MSSSKRQNQKPDKAVPKPSSEVRDTVPLMMRLVHEYPKPKDPYDFQTKCTVLFRAELKDRNAQEYGRNGQNQRGIDILGRRDGKPDHWVGVQSRKISKPLIYKTILKDSRATLALKADLKEIIFATTAPNDTGAQDAAIEVEKILRSEGRDVKVTVHGWENLCSLIAEHPIAYQAFNPSSVSTKARQDETLGDENAELRKQMSALSAKLSRQRHLQTSRRAGSPFPDRKRQYLSAWRQIGA